MRATGFLGSALAALVALSAACAQEIPDALTVEWKGKKPCEKLFEDDKIRVLRCTFGPTEVHVRHRHPPNLVYTLSGGKVQVRDDARGTRGAESRTGSFTINDKPTVHEVANIGDTVLQYLLVEMKY